MADATGQGKIPVEGESVSMMVRVDIHRGIVGDVRMEMRMRLPLPQCMCLSISRQAGSDADRKSKSTIEQFERGAP